MFNKSCFFWRFKSDVFEPHFGAYSRCERRYPYIKGCNSGASQKILWKQIVTCLAHSKERFKTNLAEYWGGGGCTVGQVTSRTNSSPANTCSRLLWGRNQPAVFCLHFNRCQCKLSWVFGSMPLHASLNLLFDQTASLWRATAAGGKSLPWTFFVMSQQINVYGRCFKFWFQASRKGVSKLSRYWTCSIGWEKRPPYLCLFVWNTSL